MTKENHTLSQNSQCPLQKLNKVQHPDQLWGPSDLLSDGYWDLFPWGKCNQCMELNTHLHLVLSLRRCGAIPPLLQYVFMAWYLVKLVTFYLSNTRQAFYCNCNFCGSSYKMYDPL
jgi:hypothetical protein